MNVQTVVLSNGQEIIGNIDHISDCFIHITNPLVLHQIRDPQTGQAVPAFAEWPALARRDQQLRIPIASVTVMPVDVHESLERDYISTTTGLSLPPAQPKILLS